MIDIWKANEACFPAIYQIFEEICDEIYWTDRPGSRGFQKKYGSNEIPDSEPTTFWDEFKETFGDPMIKILLAIAVLMIGMFFSAMRRSMSLWERSWQC